MSTHIRIALILGSLLAVAVAPGARAGGFEIPDNGTFALGRGGAFIVRADDPTALILNPGGLSRLSGTHILLNHVLIWENARFTRQPTDLPQGQDYGFDPTAPVENERPLFPLGAMFIATTDFGLDNWTFAAGVYGPSAHGSKEYPVDGGQRYMLTKLDSVLLYANLAVAYGVDEHWGVGLTLQYAMAPKVKLQLVADGSPGGQLNAYYSGNDVEAVIDMKDMTSFSAIAGAWFRIVPEIEVALSGRIIPAKFNLEGDITLENVPGQTQFSDAQREITNSSASMDITVPPSARAGVRYRHLDGEREVFDVELDVVYEAWSLMENYNVDLNGEIQLFTGAPAPDTQIAKRWKDTVSVRLGGTVNLLDDMLQLSLGGYYETGAVPKNYEHLDFLSFDRVGLGFGVRGAVGPVRLSASYAHVFQEDRKVDERYAKVYQVRPIDPCPGCDGNAGWSGVPANAGKFESSYDMLAFGLEFDL